MSSNSNNLNVQFNYNPYKLKTIIVITRNVQVEEELRERSVTKEEQDRMLQVLQREHTHSSDEGTQILYRTRAHLRLYF